MTNQNKAETRQLDIVDHYSKYTKVETGELPHFYFPNIKKEWHCSSDSTEVDHEIKIEKSCEDRPNKSYEAGQTNEDSADPQYNMEISIEEALVTPGMF